MQRYLKGEGKGDRAQNTRPSTHNFDCEKVWSNNGGSDPGSVIECGNTSSNDSFMKLCKERGISHPARFPEKLAEFFILSGSNPGDIVLYQGDKISLFYGSHSWSYTKLGKIDNVDSNKLKEVLGSGNVILEFSLN
jgi:hypothetical protein